MRRDRNAAMTCLFGDKYPYLKFQKLRWTNAPDKTKDREMLTRTTVGATSILANCQIGGPDAEILVYFKTKIF